MQLGIKLTIRITIPQIALHIKLYILTPKFGGLLEDSELQRGRETVLALKIVTELKFFAEEILDFLLAQNLTGFTAAFTALPFVLAT